MLIVTLIVLLAALTSIPKEAWWQDALTIDYFTRMADWLKDMLPQDISSRFAI
ncbi:MAG: hypothetical protein GY806_15920 [Gammaproteobacteria bacterium]|nr:hypothetical protein [Gammaproteobacteria bacterium]